MDKQMPAPEAASKGFAGVPFVTGFNGQAMRLAVWPMELWLQWQADLLKAVAPAAGDWMTRRREGTEAALLALARLTACQDAKEASKIQSEWVEGESKRLESDMRALSNPAFLWPRDSAKAGGQAAQAE